MHSLFSFGASKEMRLAIAGTGHGPEALRRQVIAANARVSAVAGGLMMPLAVFWLVAGSMVPLLVAALLLGSGLAGVSLGRRRQFESGVAIEVYAMLAIGLVLTIADPRPGDAGLAIALMAPITAALLGREALRRQSWMLVAPVIGLGVILSFAAPSLTTMSAPALLATNVVSFLAIMITVVYAATRIGTAYEVFDKAQVIAYRHLIEHVQDAVIRFSSDGEMLMASHSSEKLFGCRRYELTSCGLDARLHVLDRPAYLRAFDLANQGGRTQTLEVRMRREDPRSASGIPVFIWVEVSLSPVIGPNTTGPFEVVAMFRDITDRKDNETAMSEARRAAEEASQAKSRFLATIGHELRTPLNAIVGFSEMMTSGIGGELSSTQREYAGLIHQSGKHLIEVVRMLLDMSKIEAGRMELQTEPFEVSEIVEPCLSMVDALARERGVSVVTEIGKELPLLTADERACRQILLNLLSNAIKFSHEGGTVTVSIKRQGQAINLSVIDQGVGMAPESLARIGEAFFQVQDGLDRHYEGTGLGLSIVKGLVDLHGGTLRALSEIGSGTSVTVLLPINGPAIKNTETAVVTPLRREPATAPDSSWPDEKRKAQ
jgi:two-component system, cell cycle sensor histidine kinase DivJ